MNIAFIPIGRPGCGKGTFRKILEAFFKGSQTFSSGDELRKMAVSGNTEVANILAKGSIAPDDTVLRLLGGGMKPPYPEVWIFDGFPRTPGQAEFLVDILKEYGYVVMIIHLDLSQVIADQRIADRLDGRPEDKDSESRTERFRNWDLHGENTLSLLRPAASLHRRVDTSGTREQNNPRFRGVISEIKEHLVQEQLRVDLAEKRARNRAPQTHVRLPGGRLVGV